MTGVLMITVYDNNEGTICSNRHGAGGIPDPKQRAFIAGPCFGSAVPVLMMLVEIHKKQP